MAGFSGLQVALRGLIAEQRALDITAHNITNANTVGYTRQTAVMAPTLSQAVTLGGSISPTASNVAQLGQGVDVTSFNRVRDTFLDLQLRAGQMTLGQEQTRASALDAAQDLLGEPGETGIAAQLDKFFSSWSTLASNPESSAAKAGVVGAGQTLASSLKELDSGLAALQVSANAQFAQLSGAGGPVDQAARELGRLDAQIVNAIQNGGQPNDLLDRRDLLLDELSKLGQVSVTDLGGGSIRVGFGDAASPLVDGSTVTWPQAVTAAAGGKLGALADLGSASGTLAGYRAMLDTVASQLAGSVNAVHAGFFSGTTAQTLTVAVAPGAVTAGSTGAPGASDLARAIAGLRTGAASTSYADTVRQMGADAGEASRREANASALVQTAEARRQSVGGVSLDEEMVNLLTFQRGYQAASRAMNTMDEVLDVLINRTGRVGL